MTCTKCKQTIERGQRYHKTKRGPHHRDCTAFAAPPGYASGTVHPPKSMFLRVHVGEAKRGKLKYEMSNGMNGAPMVRSGKTGKWFSLSWRDILSLAEKAGIDA